MRLAKNLLLLNWSTLFPLFLIFVSVSAQAEIVKIGYAHGLELFQENETLKLTLEALKSRIRGVEFSLVSLSPINTLSEIKEQKLDFLIGPSNFFVEFRGSIPFTHLATRISANGKEPAKTVGSVIIARSDRTDLNDIKDLEGKSITASMPNSLGGWLAALREIHNKGKDPDSFFSSVNFTQFQTPDVISSVLNGNVDAGVLTTCVLEQIEAMEMVEKGSLKVINEQPVDKNVFACRRSTADLYPDMSFAALARAPEWLAREVTVTLLSMPEFAGYRWSIDHDQFSIDQLMKDLGLGPYSYLKDTSLPGLYYRFKKEIFIALAFILFLIFNELHLRRLVRQRTKALSEALEEKDRANEEAALTRKRFAALEKNGIISQLGTILAHEAKQPLGTLSNYLTILQIRLSKNKEKDEFCDEILETMGTQLERLNGLVNSVRNFAKKKQSPLVKTDLIEVAQKALRNYETSEPGFKKIKFRFRSALKTAYVLSEPFSLELLILNLIKNGYEEAVINSKEVPIVTVFIVQEDDRYCLEVQNSGKEMSDKDIERIVTLGESVKPEGLGLGLSIIRGIADHFGADIKFRRRTGGGVIADVFFSKYEEHIGGGVFNVLEISEIQSKVRIRVIDDDKDFLKSLGLLLEMTGWTVNTYISAKDFLEAERFTEPGCILLDLRMPEMTGLELQRTLVNRNKNRLPIIFLTGHGDVESAVYTLKNGAFDFLQKPVNPLVLNKVVVEASQKSLETFFEVSQKKEEITRYCSLTPREKEIFKLVAKGKTNKEISLLLDIALPTVKMHRGNAFDKLNVHSSVEALKLFESLGLHEKEDV